MKKNCFLFLLLAVSFSAGKSHAQSMPQPCSSDEVRNRLLAMHPEFVQKEAEFDRQVKEDLKKIDISKYARTTGVPGDTSFWYDIPIVVHIIHDYNNEGPSYPGPSDMGDFVTDDMIYNDLLNWNIVYAGANADTSNVIPTFKPYIGIPHIRLHLATIDPEGNPTHGITRRTSRRPSSCCTCRNSSPKATCR